MPVPRSEPQHRLPPGARRQALLALLREHDDGLPVAELAPLAGLHPNTVRAHLEALVRSGHATRRTESRGTRGRPREIYSATNAPEGDRRYQLLAQMLMTRLATMAQDPQAQAVEAGREWGARVAQPADDASAGGTAPDDVRAALAPVVRMLQDTGFAPRLSADGTAIELHHCPFRELAEQQPEIVCGVHLGLMQGALERLGTPVAATRILPFVQPDLCLTELSGSAAPDVTTARAPAP